MITKKVPKNYYCSKCDYLTCRKSQFDRHLMTAKHNLELNDNKKSSKNNEFSCECGKTYKFASGLSRHKIICNKSNNTIMEKDSVIEKEFTLEYDDINYKEMFLSLVKQNVELQKTIQEIVPKIGNTTTNINQKIDIHMFLNDYCKNAINLQDFINSLPISIDDLNNTTENGLIEGVTNTMIKGLSKLQLHERPIHCSDPKRDIMYIKDKNVWDRDDNNIKLKKSIENIADKQLQSFPVWEKNHPDYLHSDEGKNKYVQFVGNASIDLNEDKKKMHKIIKNIGKEVYLNKDDIINI